MFFLYLFFIVYLFLLILIFFYSFTFFFYFYLFLFFYFFFVSAERAKDFCGCYKGCRYVVNVYLFFCACLRVLMCFY